MAEKYPIANGNWNNPAIWNGGTVPLADDDVYGNGFSVTINQNVTVLSIRTTAGSVAVAGGTFLVTTGRTISANIISGTTPCLTTNVNAVGSQTITINGNITASSTTVNARGWAVFNSGYDIIVNGNVTAGSVVTGNAHGILLNAANNLTVNGNVRGGPASSNSGIATASGAPVVNITVNGEVRGGDADSSYGINHACAGLITVNNGTADAVIGGTVAGLSIGIRLTGTGRFAVTGNVLASLIARGILSSSTQTGNTIIGNITAAGVVGVEMTGSGFGLTTTGDAFGGTGTNAHGINLTVAGTLVHNGNAKGGSGTTARGINNASTGTVNVTGFAIGADNTGGVGVFNASTGLVTIGGARFGLQGWPPYAGIVHFNSLDAATTRIVRADLTTRDLQSGAFIPNYSMNGGFTE